MTIGETILTWMGANDRTLGYLARTSNLETDRIIALITAQSPPTHEDLEALAEVTAMGVGDLLSADRPAVAEVHPLQCYTVREVAHLLGVSTDTVRTEMRSGVLRYVVVGERAHRIPHAALERRLTS